MYILCEKIAKIQLWCRQKRSDSEPVREGVDVPAADLTGRPATASLQHETLQAQEGGYHAEELAIQQALRETLEQCMQSEQLPKISNLHQVCPAEHSNAHSHASSQSQGHDCL